MHFRVLLHVGKSWLHCVQGAMVISKPSPHSLVVEDSQCEGRLADTNESDCAHSVTSAYDFAKGNCLGRRKMAECVHEILQGTEFVQKDCGSTG